MVPEQLKTAVELMNKISHYEKVLSDLKSVLFDFDFIGISDIKIETIKASCNLFNVLSTDDTRTMKDMLGYIKLSLENRIAQLRDEFELL